MPIAWQDEGVKARGESDSPLRNWERIVSASGWVVLFINNAFGLETPRLASRMFDLSLIRREQEVVRIVGMVMILLEYFRNAGPVVDWARGFDSQHFPEI